VPSARKCSQQASGLAVVATSCSDLRFAQEHEVFSGGFIGQDRCLIGCPKGISSFSPLTSAAPPSLLRRRSFNMAHVVRDGFDMPAIPPPPPGQCPHDPGGCPVWTEAARRSDDNEEVGSVTRHLVTCPL
jgi:hypothetical protein